MKKMGPQYWQLLMAADTLDLLEPLGAVPPHVLFFFFPDASPLQGLVCEAKVFIQCGG